MLVSSPHVGTPSWTGFLWEIWVLSKECPGSHRIPTCNGFLFIIPFASSVTIYRWKCVWISAKLTLYYPNYDKLLSFASEVAFWASLKDFEFAVYCSFKRKMGPLNRKSTQLPFPAPLPTKYGSAWVVAEVGNGEPVTKTWKALYYNCERFLFMSRL